MIAAKHFDPILGLDVHIIQPPGPVPPLPVPHPHVGIVMDAMDYAPIIGGTVKVGGLQRAQAGTECKPISHIPIGGVFVPPPSNESEIFMGSATVECDGDAFSYIGLPVISCSTVGAPGPPRKSKKTYGLVLPTTLLLSVPVGNVLVGGPPTISLMALGMRLGMAGLSRGLKKLKKVMKKSDRMAAVAKKLHRKARKLMDKLGIPTSVRNRVHRSICSVTGHPVDIATGKVFTEAVDLELPGPIPLSLERVWYSTSTHAGQLGHGWHHSYDLGLVVDEAAGVVLLRTEDGRHLGFPSLSRGQEHHDRAEGLTLVRDRQGYAVRDRRRLSYRFAAVGRPDGELGLVAIRNRLSGEIRFEYNELGLLRRIVDSAGRVLTFDLDRRGRFVGLRVPHPDDARQELLLWRYSYDRAGNLMAVQDAVGQRASFVYQGHLLTQETDRNGLSFYFEYDGTDRQARCVHTWGDGGIYDHKLTYDTAAGITEVENSLGHRTTHVHHNGLVVQVIDALGHHVSTEYNRFFEKTSETNELGSKTTYEYDRRGNRVKEVAPDGATLLLTHDERDNPISLVDALGGMWRWRYDGRDRLVERLDPLGNSTRFHYQGLELTGLTDPAGGHTAVSFDEQHNLDTLRTPDGAETRWQHDALGRAVVMVDPRGNIKRRRFDLLGRVVEVAEPDGNVRTLRHDAEGNVVHSTDRQRDVRLSYQGMGRLAWRAEAGTEVRFEYDTEEQLTGIVNEHGCVHGFVVGPSGRVISERGFDGLLRRYTRDAAGRLIRVQSPHNRNSHYVYDKAGRVVQVSHHDGGLATYGYRPDGELVRAENEHAVVELTRDALGRVVKETQGAHWVESDHDALGMRVGMTSSLGVAHRIARNAMGDVLQVEASWQDPERVEPDGPGRRAPWQARFERDELGSELSRSLPGGVRSRWKRDRLGRPLEHRISSKNKMLRRVSYAWEVNDRLTQVYDAVHGVTGYGHDERGDLTWAEYGDGTTELRLPDAVGNLFRSRKRDDRTYGPAGQLLQVRGPGGVTRYEYDPEGNLAARVEPDGGRWQYHFDGSGMLARVVRPDGDEVAFTYDALGRRLSKTFRGRVTRWVWDGNTPLHQWQEAEVIGEQDQTLSMAVPDLDAAVELERQGLDAHPSTGPPGLITWLFEPESFAPMAKLEGGHRYGIIPDHLGTPVSMVDEAGEQVWSAEVGVWGTLRNLKGKRGDCPFRWPGQFEDEETGLYYNRFRYYDPGAGEYLSRDPVGMVFDLRLYGYVRDPLTGVDTLGLYAGEGTRDLNKYHSFHDVTLDAADYELSDRRQFQKANEALHDAIQSDPELKKTLDRKYPGVSDHVQPGRRGAFSGKSPPNMTWHHNGDVDGRLELVDRADHNKFHKVYHPDGQGGRKKWGGGSGCR